LWALQKRLNRSICHLGADSGGSKEPCIRWVRDPHRKWQFLGVVRSIQEHCKSILPAKINNGMSCGLRSKKDHSIVNNCMHQKGSFNP